MLSNLSTYFYFTRSLYDWYFFYFTNAKTLYPSVSDWSVPSRYKNSTLMSKNKHYSHWQGKLSWFPDLGMDEVKRITGYIRVCYKYDILIWFKKSIKNKRKRQSHKGRKIHTSATSQSQKRQIYSSHFLESKYIQT